MATTDGPADGMVAHLRPTEDDLAGAVRALARTTVAEQAGMLADRLPVRG